VLTKFALSFLWLTRESLEITCSVCFWSRSSWAIKIVWEWTKSGGQEWTNLVKKPSLRRHIIILHKKKVTGLSFEQNRFEIFRKNTWALREKGPFKCVFSPKSGQRIGPSSFLLPTPLKMGLITWLSLFVKSLLRLNMTKVQNRLALFE